MCDLLFGQIDLTPDGERAHIVEVRANVRTEIPAWNRGGGNSWIELDHILARIVPQNMVGLDIEMGRPTVSSRDNSQQHKKKVVEEESG